MAVFVLDRSGSPLMPCCEKRARKLLAAGRARVHRLVPFVIRLVDRHADTCAFQPLRLKLDPSSKATGLALVCDDDTVDIATGATHRRAAVLSLIELVHRGRQISEALTARRNMRRRRRSKLRYRSPRFLNRTRKEGWLAPSLQHRMTTTMAWVVRICRWVPVAALSCEWVRFDLQAIDNPEISGIEYQQGTLLGYEVREYLCAAKAVCPGNCQGHHHLKAKNPVLEARGWRVRRELECAPREMAVLRGKLSKAESRVGMLEGELHLLGEAGIEQK